MSPSSHEAQEAQKAAGRHCRGASPTAGNARHRVWRSGPARCWVARLLALRNAMTKSTSDVADATQSISGHRLGLLDSLLQECEAMARYALASGRHVPEPVTQALASRTLGASFDETKKPEGSGHERASTNHPRQDNMARQHRLEHSIRQLTYAHNRLVDIVAPATPRTILFSETSAQQAGPWEFLGRVPFVRRMMYTSILFLLGAIVTRTFLHMNVVPQGENALADIGG